MQSWVRYSVAVYFGLLLAGVLVGPVPQPSNGSSVVMLPWVGEPSEALVRPARPVSPAVETVQETPRDEPASVTLEP